jgi:hypothetical protein
MSASDILYSQDSIKCRFTDGTTLEGTFRRLLNEELRAKDIEPIDVVKDDGGRWWVLRGNRRLFLYKILEQFYLIHEIPVRVIDNVTQGSVRERFTTNTEGMSIRVRGRPQMAATLEKLCREYKDDRVDELILTNVEHSPVEYLDYPFSEYDEQYNCN